MDIFMPMCNLIEYSNNKKSGILWQYYRDEPFLHTCGAIASFSAANNNNTSFKSKPKIIDETVDGSRKDVETMVLLEYLTNFSRTLEIPLINCKINLTLTWPGTCVLSNDAKATNSQKLIENFMFQW